MNKAIFYHAGGPVCVDAEQMLLKTINISQYQLEIVHLNEQPSRLREAQLSGVQSVPALALDKRIYHINFGAALADLVS